MATKLGKKTVTRVLDQSEMVRGRDLVARMTAAGVYIKRDKERWSHAYLVSWRAVYDLGGKLRAREIKAEREKKRKLRKEGLL